MVSAATYIVPTVVDGPSKQVVSHWSVDNCFCYMQFQYISPTLIRTPLLPQNSALIREVSLGERERYMHSLDLLPRNSVLSKGVSSLESVL